MKELKKLIILFAAILAAEGALAVTLPSTSYMPSSVGSEAYGGGESAGELFSVSTFNILGTWGEDCSAGTKDLNLCQDCCNEKAYGSKGCCPNGECSAERRAECDDLYNTCANDCGRSLPLDAPLWFVILSIVMLSVAKHLAVRMRHTIN